jgi:hypothetical protein
MTTHAKNLIFVRKSVRTFRLRRYVTDLGEKGHGMYTRKFISTASSSGTYPRKYAEKMKFSWHLSENSSRMQAGARFVHLLLSAKCINWMGQNTNAATPNATTVLQYQHKSDGQKH